nr:hypothetical protein [Halobellus sp. Atlit-38R]
MTTGPFESAVNIVNTAAAFASPEPTKYISEGLGVVIASVWNIRVCPTTSGSALVKLIVAASSGVAADVWNPKRFNTLLTAANTAAASGNNNAVEARDCRFVLPERESNPTPLTISTTPVIVVGVKFSPNVSAARRAANSGWV